MAWPAPPIATSKTLAVQQGDAYRGVVTNPVWKTAQMTATNLLFRDDALLREAAATVLLITADGGIVLDRTVFYPGGGGQPADNGWLIRADGSQVLLGPARLLPDNRAVVVHVPVAAGPVPEPGESVTVHLDWQPRLKRMQIHTALHLLSCVLPFPVTGGAIGDGEGRLDFDIPDSIPDRSGISDRLNALIGQNAAVTDRWITDAELDANPGLVKTMRVKPPRGSGRVRLVEIAGIDLQPCGGTHVNNTAGIGQVAVTEIQNKGKQNRRIRIALA